MYFGEELKLPLVLSIKKLEEASVAPDTPITYKTPPIPAKSALDQLLKLLELDFVIRDEVLQITTPEDSESQLITRVYDTRTVLKRMSLEQLRERITTTIRPNSWLPAVVPYGPGEMEFYRGLLVVTQIDRAQEEIERMIESLTAAPAEAK